MKKVRTYLNTSKYLQKRLKQSISYYNSLCTGLVAQNCYVDNSIYQVIFLTLKHFIIHKYRCVVCVHVCTCAKGCMCVNMRVCLCVCTYVKICRSVCVRLCVCKPVFRYACVYECVFVCVNNS